MEQHKIPVAQPQSAKTNESLKEKGETGGTVINCYCYVLLQGMNPWSNTKGPVTKRKDEKKKQRLKRTRKRQGFPHGNLA